MADLPYGRDRWIRWDQELTSTCPECGRAWADHPGVFEIRAVDGYLGRVLPGVPAAVDGLGASLVLAKGDSHRLAEAFAEGLCRWPT